jgi:hypothetical protein
MENLSPELNALLGFLSRVGVEILKDTGKYVGGKAKALYDSLNPHIIELGISKNDDNETIQQKLAVKPEIAEEIQRKISDNQEGFNELLKFMKKNSHKVESKVKIVGDGNNVIVTAGQGDKSQPNNHIFIIAIIALTVILVIAAMYFFTFTGKTETTIQNSTVNPTINTQPTIMPTNTNVIANQPFIKPNVDRTKPAPTIKPSPTLVRTPRITKMPNKNPVTKPTTTKTPPILTDDDTSP